MHAVKNVLAAPAHSAKQVTRSRFAAKTLRHEEVVVDRSTGLMWQQTASAQPVIYRMATALIQDINKRGFAGFEDWRLPTLAEGMTLMEKLPNSSGLYIDPIFAAKERLWMWTSERENTELVWYVNFNYGYSQLNRIKSSHNYVRAVRLFRS